MFSLNFLSVGDFLLRNNTTLDYASYRPKDVEYKDPIFFTLRFNIFNGPVFKKLTDKVALSEQQEIIADTELSYKNGYQKFVCIKSENFLFESLFYQDTDELSKEESDLLGLYIKIFILYKDNSTARNDIEELYRKNPCLKDKKRYKFLELAFSIRKYVEETYGCFLSYFKFILLCYCKEIYKNEKNEIPFNMTEEIYALKADKLTKVSEPLYDTLMKANDFLEDSMIFVNENAYLFDIVGKESNIKS